MKSEGYCAPSKSKRAYYNPKYVDTNVKLCITFKRITGNRVSFYNSKIIFSLMYAIKKNHNQICLFIQRKPITKIVNSESPVKVKPTIQIT